MLNTYHIEKILSASFLLATISLVSMQAPDEFEEKQPMTPRTHQQSMQESARSKLDVHIDEYDDEIERVEYVLDIFEKEHKSTEVPLSIPYFFSRERLRYIKTGNITEKQLNRMKRFCIDYRLKLDQQQEELDTLKRPRRSFSARRASKNSTNTQGQAALQSNIQLSMQNSKLLSSDEPEKPVNSIAYIFGAKLAGIFSQPSMSEITRENLTNYQLHHIKKFCRQAPRECVNNEEMIKQASIQLLKKEPPVRKNSSSCWWPCLCQLPSSP